MSHLHLGESNKHWLTFTQCTATRKSAGRKKRAENKGGEPDAVSTATLIDILQVEQLSSGLTTAS